MSWFKNVVIGGTTAKQWSSIISVFCIQTQTHAVSWNIAKLYELFTTYEMLFLAIYSPFKKNIYIL